MPIVEWPANIGLQLAALGGKHEAPQLMLDVMRNFLLTSASKLRNEMPPTLQKAAAVFIALLLLISLGCGWKKAACQKLPGSQSNATPTPRTTSESEKYAVLSALIKDMYVDERTKLLVIAHQDPCPTPSQADETSDQKAEEMRQQTEDYAFKKMPQLARQTIDDFHARVKECNPLGRQLDVPIEYVLIGQKDVEALFPKGDFDLTWSRFYAKYPGSSGIINFWNLGFNRDFTQALVSTSRGCGGLCGASYLVLLTKEHGVWKVQSKILTLIS